MVEDAAQCVLMAKYNRIKGDTALPQFIQITLYQKGVGMTQGSGRPLEISNSNSYVRFLLCLEDMIMRANLERKE